MRDKNGPKCEFCHITISQRFCKGCPHFEKEWEDKINESQYSYCILYEAKSMCECAGASFSEVEGRYECECMKDGYSDLVKYAKCDYKTIREEFLK